LCRARLDCSPLDLINRRLTLEAQRLLRYTSASVEQVAQELGFGDPSYFSRFYLRMTGHRPAWSATGPQPTVHRKAETALAKGARRGLKLSYQS
jgi:AraC family transcriptional activator of pobA